MTAVASPAALTTSRFDGSYRPTLARLLRSEWIKLRSLRSTGWAVVLTVAIMAGFSALVAFAATGFGDGAPTSLFLVVGYPVAQLVVGVLGALVITGEYATGAFRSTLAAEPRRVRVVLAKAVLVAAVSAVVSAVSVALAGIASFAIFTAAGSELPMAFDELLRTGGAVVGYLTLAALFALGIGLLVKNTAAAISIVVGAFFVGSIIMQIVGTVTGADWAWIVFNWLPSIAGSQMMEGMGMGVGEFALGATAGAAVLGGYTLLALVAGTVAFVRRDD